MEMFDMELYYDILNEQNRTLDMQNIYGGHNSVNNGFIKTYSVMLFTLWFWYII